MQSFMFKCFKLALNLKKNHFLYLQLIENLNSNMCVIYTLYTQILGIDNCILLFIYFLYLKGS